MNRRVRVCMFVVLWLGVLCVGFAQLGFSQEAAALAANPVPNVIRFGGMLSDVSGKTLSGVQGVTFLLYGSQQGGAPLWMETQNVVAAADGKYSAILGSTKSEGLPAGLFANGEARWLAIQIAGEPEQPRVLLVAVPYAIKAGDAQTLGGLPASAFARANSPGANAAGAVPVAKGGNSLPANSTAANSAVANSTNALNVTTTGGKINTLPLFSTASDVENSAVIQTGTGSTARIGINATTPSATLDVGGGATIRGLLNLPSAATATASAGAFSRPFGFVASAFNSGTAAAVNQVFHWQAEPASNDTASPSATLNLLFGTAPNAPAETGFKINSNGQLTFASGQTFPGAGTITGVTAGTGLTGGGTGGNVSLGLDTTQVVTGVKAGTDLTGGGNGGLQTINLDTTKVPQLATANTFTANQTVNANVIATGIGVGTSSPLAALHVDHRPVSGGQDTVLVTSGGSGDVASLALMNTGPGLRLRMGVGTTSGYLASSGTLSFMAGDTGTPNQPKAPAISINLANTTVFSGTVQFGPPVFFNSAITFASGQTFPGAAQLNAANTFTGNQSVTGNVSASGTLIGSGLSVSGGGIINGGLTTSAGISTGAGVVVGAGLSAKSVAINGDTAMTAAPHMYFSGMMPGAISFGQVGAVAVPSKNILITRLSFWSEEDANGCSPTGTISLVNGGNLSFPSYYDLSVNQTNNMSDSGPLSIAIPAGTHLVVMVTQTPSCGAFVTIGNVAISVEYVMQ